MTTVRRSFGVRAFALATAAGLALAGLAALQTAGAPAARADDVTVFDSIPGDLPQNWASQGFQAYSMQEFGQRLQLAGTARTVTSVTIGFSSWTCENWATSDPCATTTPGTGYDLPVSVQLYRVADDGSVGALVATTTRTITVPFRPSPSGAPCTGTQFSLDGGATCTSGLAFTADFPFDDRPAVPTDLIVTVQYSTRTFGPAPTGVKSPADSFNVGLEGVLTTGAVADSDHSVYVNSNNARWYTSTETGDDIDPSWVGTLHAGAHWDPYAPVPIRITATSEAPAPPALPDTDTPPPAASTEGANGLPLEPPVLPSTPPPAGGSVDVSFAPGTFEPFEWVQFSFYSVPQYSGALQAAANGSLSGSIPVPAALPGGAHTLAAVGTISGVVSTASIYVSALAATGLDGAQTTITAGIGAVVLLTGLVLVLAAWRRRA